MTDENVALEMGRGVAHSFNCRMAGMRLADALVIISHTITGRFSRNSATE